MVGDMIQINLDEERVINSAFSLCRAHGQTFFSTRDVQREIFLEEGYSVKSSEWKGVCRIIPGAKISAILRKHQAFSVLDDVGRRAAKFYLNEEVVCT